MVRGTWPELDALQATASLLIVGVQGGHAQFPQLVACAELGLVPMHARLAAHTLRLFRYITHTPVDISCGGS
jgi:hypothetical protein